MPRVSAAIRGRVQPWPKSAAGWSPSIAAIGVSKPATAPAVCSPESSDGPDRREQRPGDAEQVEQAVVPVERCQVDQERPAGVRGFADVTGCARELPGKPAGHIAEAKLAGRGSVAQDGIAFEEPGQLGRREGGVKAEAGHRSDTLGGGILRQSGAQVARPLVLPADDRRHRLTRLGVPEHERLGLVGDADPGDGAVDPRPAPRRGRRTRRRRARPGRVRPFPARGGPWRGAGPPLPAAAALRHRRRSGCSSFPGRWRGRPATSRPAARLALGGPGPRGLGAADAAAAAEPAEHPVGGAEGVCNRAHAPMIGGHAAAVIRQ